MKISQKRAKQDRLKQFFQYLISGGAYFWSGYGMFFIADQLIHMNLWWAKLAANMTGWTVNYVLQRYWVFNHPNLLQKKSQVTFRYIVLTAANFVIDYLIVKTLNGVGVSPYIGQFASAGFFTGWNYLWYRFWVFKESPKHGKKHGKK